MIEWSIQLVIPNPNEIKNKMEEKNLLEDWYPREGCV